MHYSKLPLNNNITLSGLCRLEHNVSCVPASCPYFYWLDVHVLCCCASKCYLFRQARCFQYSFWSWSIIITLCVWKPCAGAQLFRRVSHYRLSTAKRSRWQKRPEVFSLLYIHFSWKMRNISRTFNTLLSSSILDNYLLQRNQQDCGLIKSQ